MSRRQRFRLVEPVSDDQIAAMVRAGFGRSARAVEVRVVDHVQFNTVYDVRIEEPSVRAILRIAPADGKPLFDHERGMMGREKAIADLFRAAGVPVPDVLACDCSRTAIDRDFIFIRHVESKAMCEEAVPSVAKPGLWRQVGSFTARIHAVRSVRFGWPQADGSVTGSDRWSDVVLEMLWEVSRRCAEAGIVSRRRADAIRTAVEERRGLFDACIEPVLTHNDLWEPNVLVAGNGDGWSVAGIVDVDRAMFSDRELDFVLWNPNPDFLSGYGRPVDDSPEAALRRAYYELWGTMYGAWAYAVQIDKPAELLSCRKRIGALCRRLGVRR
jgi:aminoglycoside phosphotransferase (APT) family kinase protein